MAGGLEFADGMPPAKYSAAVGRLLALHESPTLDRLRIVVHPSSSNRFPACARTWVDFAVSKKVKELEVDTVDVGSHFSSLLGVFVHGPTELCEIPGSMFHSRSLNSLSLSFCCIMPPFDPLEMPLLRSLTLRQVENICEATIASLLQHCPLLVTLKLVKCDTLELIKIASSHLTSLAILHCAALRSVEISTQMLKSFYFYQRSLLPVVVALNDVPSLGDVYANTEHHLATNWQFLQAPGHCTTLTLSRAALMGLYMMVLPPLPSCNLKTLRLTMKTNTDLELLSKNLLNNPTFAALENIFVDVSEEFSHFYCENGNNSYKTPELPVSRLFPSKLKLVCIRGFARCTNPLRAVKFFLATAESLETLMLLATHEEIALKLNDEAATLLGFLKCLPRASRSAKILLAAPGESPIHMPHAEIHTEVMRISD